MYYGIDDNGHIVSSGQDSVLPSEFTGLYPSDVSDLSLTDGTDIAFSDSLEKAQDTVSGSDVSPVVNNYTVTAGEEFDYEYMVDLLSNMPLYAVYPNVQAVDVFSDVLNGLDGDYGYIIYSGSDTYTTYLVYSEDYSVSGSTLSLTGNVTECRYYRYRPSNTQPWQYLYTVSGTGDQSFNLSNQLVYTNLVDGYPDVVPYKQKENFSLLFSIPLLIAVMLLMSLYAVRRNHV